MSGGPSVIYFEQDASAEHAFFGFLSMPDLDDLMMHEIARWGIAGQIFADAGQELELRSEKRF